MQLNEGLSERLRAIRAVIFDMDGVFTDGSLYLSADGTEMRRFNTRDGLGVKRLLDAGIRVAVISGRRSSIVEQRMAELGVSPVHLGVEDKGAVFEQTLRTLGIEADHVAAAGDDLPDLEMLNRAHLAIAVADAVASVRAAAHWVTTCGGGNGAVREIADAILASRENA
jgi:3-deoxy-D-manno-octulosonate 8-phosphate phosphatase (KDO 8-P phosphatase)